MKCIPLDITNKIASKYTDCWKTLDGFIEWKKTGETDWDDRCYIPIAATIATTTGGNSMLALSSEIIQDAYTMAAVAPWRLYKQIYTFHEDMEKLLFEQADDLVIPIEVLNNLPFQSIYIQLKTAKDIGGLLNNIDGFFVHFESDVNDGRLEFRFLLVGKDGESVTPIIIHLKDGNTIKDGIDQMIEETKSINLMGDNIMNYIDDEDVDLYSKYACETTSKIMQLVLYICAENREIEEDKEQSKITREPKSKEFIKDKFREVRKWNCGENTGNIVRGIYKRGNYKQYEKSEESGKGSPKRPHFRRAHWHHFWKGSASQGNRRLELKWVAPTFINENLTDTDIVKINEVK